MHCVLDVVSQEACKFWFYLSHQPMLRRPIVLHTHLPGEGSPRAYGKLGLTSPTIRAYEWPFCANSFDKSNVTIDSPL